jgi:hypothetical protein
MNEDMEKNVIFFLAGKMNRKFEGDCLNERFEGNLIVTVGFYGTTNSVYSIHARSTCVYMNSIAFTHYIIDATIATRARCRTLEKVGIGHIGKFHGLLPLVRGL